MTAADRDREYRDLNAMVAMCRDRAAALGIDMPTYILDLAVVTMEEALSRPVDGADRPEPAPRPSDHGGIGRR